MAVLAFSREATQVSNCLTMGGFKKMVVRLMGEKLMLLEYKNPTDIEDAEMKMEPWWRALFSEVHRWSPNHVTKFRKVWLRVSGLPLHVWDEKNFELLRNFFGIFLDFDQETVGFTQLDFARI